MRLSVMGRSCWAICRAAICGIFHADLVLRIARLCRVVRHARTLLISALFAAAGLLCVYCAIRETRANHAGNKKHTASHGYFSFRCELHCVQRSFRDHASKVFSIATCALPWFLCLPTDLG